MYEGLVYHISVKFGVARFDNMGNFQAPRAVKRATDGLHVLIYMYLESSFITSMRSPIVINTYQYNEKSMVYACDDGLYLCRL